jgi:1,2-phenylacetyl-CoA epoxidase catalytic subunit
MSALDPAPSGLFETATDQDALARAAAAAAPVAVERADLTQVGTLAPSLRQPMFSLLSSLADNKYVLGRRYAEWCTGAPLLESAVAAAAMAQDELGHARSFYPLLRGFPEGQDAPPMEERGWQQRPTHAMRCLDQSFDTWADFVAVNLVVDTALTVLLSAALGSSYEPLRQRSGKIVQEEAAHWVHATGWLLRQPDTVLAPALVRVWDDAMTWYGQDVDPALTTLAQAGVLSMEPAALRRALLARIEPVLAAKGLASDLLARPLPWSRWDPRTRRLRI